MYTQASELRTGRRWQYPRAQAVAAAVGRHVVPAQHPHGTGRAVAAARVVQPAYIDEALYLGFGHLDDRTLAARIASTTILILRCASNVPAARRLADGLRGLAGARLLSLAFMLGATGGVYATAFRILGRSAAIAAAGVFAGLGAVQFLRALATFDAISVCLPALLPGPVIRAGGRLSELLLWPQHS